ncbi:MAG: hypothetical protein HY273_00325 [Gammaproteobacteria bacterium]|nr:hypothetical protein [Gammaproteobacteria bacterium]
MSIPNAIADKPAAAAPPAAKVSVEKLARRGELSLALALPLLFAAVFFYGRMHWNERIYTAQEGLGYFLGLAGGIMILLALVYAFTKRVAFLRPLLRYMLRIHIFFGVVGPFLILLHSTFHIGSLNGGIALVSMTLVFLSGVIGRYLYSKIHFGLDGRKAQVREVIAAWDAAGHDFSTPQLDSFQRRMLSTPGDVVQATLRVLLYVARSGWVAWHTRRELKQRLRAQAQREGWDAPTLSAHWRDSKRRLRMHFALLKKVALFSAYERFFAFWLHAHVPLLYLLLLSGIVHVFAVHLY